MYHILEKQNAHYVKEMGEHAYFSSNKTKESAIYQQFLSCEHYNHLLNLFRLQNDTSNLKKFKIQLIKDNWEVLIEQKSRTFYYLMKCTLLRSIDNVKIVG